MDFTAKNADVVDFGGEVDYSGHQWFQEPPPRPEVRLTHHPHDVRTLMSVTASACARTIYPGTKCHHAE